MLKRIRATPAAHGDVPRRRPLLDARRLRAADAADDRARPGALRREGPGELGSGLDPRRPPRRRLPSPGLGFGATALIRSSEGASAVVNLIVLPMAFLSGSFGPTRHYPEVLQWIADVLPLTYLHRPDEATSTCAATRSSDTPEGDRDRRRLGPRRRRRSRGGASAGSRASGDGGPVRRRRDPGRRRRRAAGARRRLRQRQADGRARAGGSGGDRDRHEREAARGGPAPRRGGRRRAGRCSRPTSTRSCRSPTASFDAVTSRLALMAADDPVATLRELRRVLEPGGRLVTVLWASPAENPWFGGAARGDRRRCSGPSARPSPGRSAGSATPTRPRPSIARRA